MCDHGLFYRHVQQLQQRRPTWSCGTCGRVSSHPLDCCARPAFTRRAAVPAWRKSLRWGRVVEGWRMLHLQGLLQRSGQFLRALGRRRTETWHAYEVPTTIAAMHEQPAEAAEVGNIPVAAGDRQ
jgi:hypothetical protein